MGTGIYGDPNEYEFGLDFDYSVWTPGTKVDLVNVPFNNDYRDVVKFNSRSDLDAYINSRATAGTTVNQLSYVKPNLPIRLDIPFNRAIKFNYLRASNPVQPITGNDVQKNFYYFILDVRYIAPNTIELVLQLDIWQTYIYDVTFGMCYVERGHVGIANQNAFNSYGRDYLTVPEGLDIGSHLQVIAKRNRWIMTPTPHIPSATDRYPGFDVLVVSTVDLTADAGTVAAPVLNTATGTTFQGTTQGADFYIFDLDQFSNFLNLMSEKPWVTQGIISVTMIPRFEIYHPDWEYGENPTIGKKATTLYPKSFYYGLFANWRNSSEILNNLPVRYRHLKKFLTSPYLVIEMTTFNGTPIVIQPELWNEADAIVFERATLVPPAQRIDFMPMFYNSKITSVSDMDDLWPDPMEGFEDMVWDDEGEWLDFMTQIANFPTMSIVNNGAISYLASNQHGIAFSHSSADWTQQRALGTAQGQYDIATGAIETMRNLTELGNIGAVAQTGIQNKSLGDQAWIRALGAVGGGAGGGAVFGARGAAAGAVSGGAAAITSGLTTGIEMETNNAVTNAANLTRRAETAISAQQGTLMRDTNKSVADWAARGDYANQVAGINAKVQDAKMIQPTTSGQIGGETSNIVNGGLVLSLRWKMIDQASIRRIGDFWLRYGYAVRAAISLPASLHVMSKFTYWKLTETYITSATVPEGMKQGIRGILEKGVTVWVSPSDIGNIDWADNAPLSGVSY